MPFLQTWYCKRCLSLLEVLTSVSMLQSKKKKKVNLSSFGKMCCLAQTLIMVHTHLRYRTRKEEIKGSLLALLGKAKPEWRRLWCRLRSCGLCRLLQPHTLPSRTLLHTGPQAAESAGVLDCTSWDWTLSRASHCWPRRSLSPGWVCRAPGVSPGGHELSPVTFPPPLSSRRLCSLPSGSHSGSPGKCIGPWTTGVVSTKPPLPFLVEEGDSLSVQPVPLPSVYRNGSTEASRRSPGADLEKQWPALRLLAVSQVRFQVHSWALKPFYKLAPALPGGCHPIRCLLPFFLLLSAAAGEHVSLSQHLYPCARAPDGMSMAKLLLWLSCVCINVTPTQALNLSSETTHHLRLLI